jgi:hypothetical protein
MIELGPHGAGLFCQLTHQRPERALTGTVPRPIQLDHVIGSLLQICQRLQARKQRALPSEHRSDLEVHDSVDQRLLVRKVATDLRAADPRRGTDPFDAHLCDAEPDDELSSAPDYPVPRRRIPASPSRGSLLEFLSGHPQMLTNPDRPVHSSCRISVDAEGPCAAAPDISCLHRKAANQQNDLRHLRDTGSSHRGAHPML